MRKSTHNVNKNKGSVRPARIPLSVAIRPAAGNEGLPQPVDGSKSPVAVAATNPPVLPAPQVLSDAGNIPQLHQGGRVPYTGVFELEKGEHVTAAKKKYSPLPDGRVSPDSIVKRDGKKRFAF